MAAGRALAMTALVAGLFGCGLLSGDDGASKSKAMDETDAIRIVLDANQPDLSNGVIYDPKAPPPFQSWLWSPWHRLCGEHISGRDHAIGDVQSECNSQQDHVCDGSIAHYKIWKK